MGRGQNRRRIDGASTTGPGRAGVRCVVLAVASLALAAVAVAGGAYGWRAVKSAQSLRIREVRFRGLVHASADDLMALSPVKCGDHLLLSDLSAMQTALARDPWVRSVEVRRRWPPALEVTVHERTAAALVDLGGLYLVDGQGNVFKRAAAGDGTDLPVVTGLARAEYVKKQAAVEPLLQGALALVRAWSDRGRDASTRLSEIHVDPVDGITLYLGEEGAQVRLGTGDLAAKLVRLDRVLAALRAEGRKADVLHLDNRVHPSWVTVHMADAEGAKTGGR